MRRKYNCAVLNTQLNLFARPSDKIATIISLLPVKKLKLREGRSLIRGPKASGRESWHSNLGLFTPKAQLLIITHLYILSVWFATPCNSYKGLLR